MRPLTQPTHVRASRIGLEVALVLLVITVTSIVLWSYTEPATSRAQFAQALIGLATARNGVVEDYAHAGAWSSSQRVDPEQRQKLITDSDGTHIDRAGDALIASGKIAGRAFALPMRPAVAAHSENWTVVFVCGSAQPPAGWHVAPSPDVAKVSPFVLPHVCRSGTVR